MYRLAAFDMDGTLLNSSKQVSPASTEAFHRASLKGKTIALCTGRAAAGIGPYIADGSLADARYGVLCSGSLVMDLKEKKAIYRTVFTDAQLEAVLKAMQGRDIFLQLMVNGTGLITSYALENLGKYGMEPFKDLYLKTATVVEDTTELLSSGKVECEKINIWHGGDDPLKEREETAKCLSDLGLTTAYSERSNFELTPPGTSKGSGLKRLCDYLHIPMEETIGVGDADNDRTMFEVVGLPVAMGNASKEIKENAAVTVADNDHDGCAEVVDRYLLSE